jgi:hypothetical protein
MKDEGRTNKERRNTMGSAKGGRRNKLELGALFNLELGVGISN